MKIKERLLDYMERSAYKPMLKKELMDAFSIDKNQRKEFGEALKEMEKEGYIIQTKTNRYAVPERLDLVVGRLEVFPKGFGFLISEKKDSEDLFIPPGAMNGAMNNDRVIGRIESPKTETSRAEGEIIRIIKRGNKEIVGTYESSKNFGFVIPDDKRIQQDIFIPKGKEKGASTRQKVVCQIVKWPEGRRKSPEGKVSEILGYQEDKGVDILSIIKQHQLPLEFQKNVLSEAEGLKDEIPKAELQRRKDLRNHTIVTIDGADAKDLDDGVSLEKLNNGNFKLGVHIADVTHYVGEGTFLDEEAMERGTSVYLIDRVIPMLPEKLSNNLCSLNPNTDKLAVSVFMEIDSKGNVQKEEIFESVINSKERLVYEDVSDILEEEDQELMKRYKDYLGMFDAMKELSQILRKKRMDRGAIDFDCPEARIILDDEGNPVDIEEEERRIANRIIEEFMLVCNETVAERYHWLEIPFLYRIHQEPDLEEIQEFNRFIYNFGYKIKGIQNEVHPKALQEINEKVKGKKEEKMLNTLMLRSLQKAEYSADNIGHFGLAADYYSHFTSPIRRYPDLMIHRIIKWHLKEELSKNLSKKLEKNLPKIADQSSTREREAASAERETVDLKKAEYMSNKIGEEFEGVITSLTSFGIFVELPNTIEGLIRLSSLTDDYYHYDRENQQILGERRKKRFRIGDSLLVKVAKVNVMEGEVNFTLVNGEKSEDRTKDKKDSGKKDQNTKK